MTEEWRDIAGYEGHYQVSNQGRVISVKFNKKKLLKVCNTGKGYPSVILSLDSVAKCARVHVLVAEAFIRPREKKEVVMHRDNNPENNHISNLKVGSYSENNQQRFDDGYRPTGLLRERQVRGEKVGTSVLSEDKVLEIKSKLGYRNCAKLAREYGVARSTIQAIKQGRSWAYLENPG